MKKSVLTVFFLTAVLVLSFSCQKKTTPEKQVSDKKISRNILKDFEILEKVYPTRYIEAADSDHNPYFISGWYPPEKNIRWAQGNQSILSFNATHIHDLTLEIKCRSIESEAPKKQKVKIFLNSKPVKTIKPDSFFDVYQISLPQKFLIIGSNTLTFKCKLAGRPSAFSDKDDTRLLSMAFEYFKFFHSKKELSGPSQPLSQNKSGEIIHFPQSAFTFYLKPSGKEELKASISRLPKNTTAHIRISSDEGTHKTIDFKKTDTKTTGLQNFSHPYLKLSFYMEAKRKHRGFPKDFVVWSKINILEPEKQVKPKPKLTELYQKLSSKKFDIVYIVLDAFHAKHSSLYGYHRDTTPFLKKIGEKGVVFQHFYANTPYTLASSGTFFTSRYPHEHGLIEKDTKLNSLLSTIPEILQEHSISSFLLTGHPWFSEDWGLSRGFTNIYFKKYNKKVITFTSSLKTLYSENKSEQQKFIYIHAHPPHAPYVPPKEFQIFPKPEYISFNPTPQNFRKIENGEIKVTDDLLDYIESMYDANVLYADSLAQDIYHFFKENNLLDHTILIFASDHGEACKMQHGKLGHNTTLFQEMVYIPFIMVFPEKLGLYPIDPQVPSSVVDASPTILELFGITNDYGFRGKSLLPFIFSPSYNSDHVFLENFSGKRQQKGIIEHQYKFISTKYSKMLFDIKNDYTEKDNLFLEMPTASGYFRQLIRSYSSPYMLKSEKIDLEKIDEKTKEQLRSLGYIK